MPGLIGAVWVAALAVGAPDVGLGAAIRTETSGGMVPRVSETESNLAAELFVTPELALDLQTPTSEVGATYSPRMLMRMPSEIDRPLVLHQGTLRWAQRLTELHRWETAAFGRVGELDYSRGALLRDDEGDIAGELQPLAIVNYFEVGGTTGLVWRASPRHELEVRAGGGYRGPLDDATSVVYAYQRRGFLELGDGISLTPLDLLTVRATAEIVDYSTDARFVTVTPRIGWNRRLNRLDTLSVSAGSALTHGREPLETPAGGVLAGSMEESGLTNRFIWLPVADAYYRRSLVHRRAVRAAGRVGAGVQPYYDPFRAMLEPRAFGTLGAEATFATGTAAILEGQVTSAVDSLRYPAGEDDEDLPSFIFVRAGVGQRISRYLQVEVGGRWTHRGIGVLDMPDSFAQTELVGYVAIVGGVGTRAVDRD